MFCKVEDSNKNLYILTDKNKQPLLALPSKNTCIIANGKKFLNNPELFISTMKEIFRKIDIEKDDEKSDEELKTEAKLKRLREARRKLREEKDETDAEDEIEKDDESEADKKKELETESGLIYDTYLFIIHKSYMIYKFFFPKYDIVKIDKWLNILKNFGPGNFSLFMIFVLLNY